MSVIKDQQLSSTSKANSYERIGEYWDNHTLMTLGMRRLKRNSKFVQNDNIESPSILMFLSISRRKPVFKVSYRNGF